MIITIRNIAQGICSGQISGHWSRSAGKIYKSLLHGKVEGPWATIGLLHALFKALLPAPLHYG